jgi:hypothetical protein
MSILKYPYLIVMEFMILALKGARKIYLNLTGNQIQIKPDCIKDADVASQIIYDALNSDDPCMIARFGANELLCLKSYLGVKQNDRNIFSYISGKSNAWWWNKQNLVNMNIVAGFFPAKIDKFIEFGNLMLEDIKEVDILGSWLADEHIVATQLKSVRKVHLRLLEPFWSSNPWSKALSEKKVLVVHPFAETILYQYDNRDKLFDNQEILPRFKSLHVIKAVQPMDTLDNRFNDWFEALNYMKSEIDLNDYYICLIGCGAYGFHLAAHVKRSGKKAVHLGGALQLLFGIRGKRWENPNYEVNTWGIPKGLYSNLMNEYWVRPSNIYKPKNAEEIEGACYW